MNKIKTIFQCFGIIKGSKYILFKLYGLILRCVFVGLGRKPKKMAKILKQTAEITDQMVRDYIYYKYKGIYHKFDFCSDDGKIPVKKIIWTAWLQGEKNKPFVIEKSIISMQKNSNDYDVVVITFENIDQYLNIDEKIMNLINNGKISYAHFTDYLRISLLKKYGGIWLDASQFMIRSFPKEVWDSNLLLWNTVYDITDRNLYASIPFVEKFNNGFLIAKKDSLFFKFADEITTELLFDPILKIDYFTFFKAYLAAFEHIPVLNEEWRKMRVFNPYGLITRQLWNKPLTLKTKKIINLPENYFFTMTYKKEWKKEIDGEPSVEEYILEKFEK
ncbi:capsular polysaccharide synthesis protein [Companilactobacillus kimchiensis]|uniref:Capsular polysaccharide synthesis protein n=1 Tax=Companilactobacillus kimchiensis TaxID=993692 RepID=A0A0R2LNS5_9LACO|nr:capsular polysaccharide synthesis protein [Companilactobacillus kimchiensis]KRO00387.1 hypothetical protein IV57_GL001491 [Companilactobacillus kimchiensis]